MKAESASSKRLEIHDERLATLLLSTSSVCHLGPFMGRENTIAQAAKSLGVDIRQVYR